MANTPPANMTSQDALKFAKAVVQSNSRNSITRAAANEAMFIYPMVMGADVPIDDAIPYVNEVERTLAALVVAVISVNSDFSLDKYMNPSNYLKKFHSNENASAILRALNLAVSQATETFTEFSKCTEAHITKASIVPDEIARTMSPDYVLEAFIDTGLPFNSGKLNDEYTPHVGTQSAMESLVNDLRMTLRPAMEASGGAPGNPADKMINSVITMSQRGVTNENRGAADKNYMDKTKGPKMIPRRDPVTGDPLKDSNGDTIMVPMVDDKGKIITEETSKNVVLTAQTGKQQIVRNDRMASMEPTLINIQLTGYQSGGTTIVHNVVLAVKVDCRQCPTDVMVDQLSKAVMGSRAVFNFIKWTRGQYGFLKDFILGVSNAKEGAIGSRDTKQWLQSLKRGKMKGAVSKLTGDSMPPITIIVATANDVAKVQQATGVDLTQPYAVIKMMNKYYMLGFSIIDTANGKVMTLFDGDTDFSITSLNALRGRSTSKEADLSSYVSLLRAMGGAR